MRRRCVAATKSAPAAALPTHPASAGPAHRALPGRIGAGRHRRAISALAATPLMLALPGIGALRGAFLGPTNNCRRQQNHKP